MHTTKRRKKRQNPPIDEPAKATTTKCHNWTIENIFPEPFLQEGSSDKHRRSLIIDDGEESPTKL
jgi:hypothetical protein